MTRIAADKPSAIRHVPKPELPPRSKLKDIGKGLQELGKKPPLAEIKRHFHNQQVARGLKENIQDTLKLVRFGAPLNKAESPRAGKNGQMTAPNGDPLIRVKLNDGSGVAGASQYALVNPKTNEFYLQTNGGGFMHPTTYNGPVSLPKDSRFQGSKFTPADIRSFETLANAPKKPTLGDVLKNLNELEFNSKKPANAGTEKLLKSEHPFSYYVVTLKGDPKHVVIKKVLTGGFVPAQPGDGSYSEPIAIK